MLPNRLLRVQFHAVIAAKAARVDASGLSNRKGHAPPYYLWSRQNLRSASHVDGAVTQLAVRVSSSSRILRAIRRNRR